MQDSSTLSHAQKMLSICKEAIVELLDALGVEDPHENRVPFNMISFHYPLHRYFALFASNAIARQGLLWKFAHCTLNILFLNEMWFYWLDIF